MNHVIIPKGYVPSLGLYDTQKAIGLLKRLFEDRLSAVLKLRRVSAPLFVEAATGLNDDLNGIERPVSFDIPSAKCDAQVVHSLAKWKRMALKKYDFYVGKGIYTDMNAIRRDEELDNLHSIYVDQWDWEKVISREDRNLDYLHRTVEQIVGVICDTCDTMRSIYPQLGVTLSKEIKFITSQELEDMYPQLSAKEREKEIVKKYKTVFLEGIGGKLKSGQKHDGRAPDYDDWTMNGDILFWHETLGTVLEISSMGIRVDEKAMDKQLHESGCDDRRSCTFHKQLLEGKLPLTIGGGIGQSRLCMLLLGKVHIGEVQASVWDDDTIEICKNAGVPLL